MRLNLSREAQFWRMACERLKDDLFVAIIHVARVRGSAPREAGALMGVTVDGSCFGTIGGGALEFQAHCEAVKALNVLRKGGKPATRRLQWALGPELGQCCGGHVEVAINTFTLNEIVLLDGYFQDAISGDARQPVLLCGAGHVGRAVALALAPLPFRVTWLDSREDAFPAHVPANATPQTVADPVAAVSIAQPGSFVLVMTHDHGLDLAITAAALGRADLPFVGLIGSATKRARFVRQLRTAGIDEARIAALTCPIGLPGITGKEPAVIAASVAAQLLMQFGEVRAHATGVSTEPPGQVAGTDAAL